MARLRVVASVAGQVQVVDLDPDRELRVGRRLETGLFLEDDRVSRSHARFEPDGGIWRLTDMGSTNGTFVNGNQLRPWEPHRLYDGDRIRIGGSAIDFMGDPAEIRAAARETTPDGPERTVRLTATEREVLELLFMHYDERRPAPKVASLADIAKRRITSVDAVKGHLRSMFDKFDLIGEDRNKETLAVTAQEWHMTARRY